MKSRITKEEGDNMLFEYVWSVTKVVCELVSDRERSTPNDLKSEIVKEMGKKKITSRIAPIRKSIEYLKDNDGSIPSQLN